MPRTLGALAMALAALVEARAAHAEGRKELLQRAMQARAAGEHREALALAREAAAMQATASLQRFIAEELAELGQNVEAFASAEECVRMVPEAPKRTRNDEAVLTGCQALGRELRSHVALVTLVPPAPPPRDLVVSIAGGPPRPPPSGHFAVPPGPWRVTARAEGYAAFEWAATLQAGSEIDVTLTLTREPLALPANTELPAKAPPTAPAVAPRPIAPPPSDPGVAAPRSGVPLVVAGAGVALAAAGGIVYLVSNTRYDDLKASCPQPTAPTCPADASEQRANIGTLDTLALAFALGGGAFALGGAAWYLLDRRAPPRARALIVGPSFVGYAGAF